MKRGATQHYFELHDHNYPDSLLDRTYDVSPAAKKYILEKRDEAKQEMKSHLLYRPETVQRIIDRIKVIEMIRWEETDENDREWMCERSALVED